MKGIKFDEKIIKRLKLELMSNTKLAGKIGITRCTLSNIVNHRHEISELSAKKICSYYGLDFEKVMGAGGIDNE